MKNKKRIIVFSLPVIIALVVYLRLQPLHWSNNVSSYTGNSNLSSKPLSYDKEKKTVVIMADNEMTELFDLMAPFYLFSEAGKANVYITAPKKYPVATKNGPFIMPHFSYTEMDSLKIHPDVIVIPYMNTPESPIKTSWIKKHYADSVIILSICDGAWTAAASGIYDGKPLASHATGHEKLKEKFSKPHWVENIRFTQSGNLFSTGGVSNAADGSLAVIEKLFGHETMLRVMKTVHYSYNDLHKSHNSIALNGSGKITALYKILFKENKRIGVVLQSGVNEMEMAAVYDTYNRALPQRVQTIIIDGNSITTRYGLTLLSTDAIIPDHIDQLHLLQNNAMTQKRLHVFKHAQVISYDNYTNDYILDVCLDEIKKEYGQTFYDFVKVTLDYN